jgi:hypothetical protein
MGDTSELTSKLKKISGGSLHVLDPVETAKSMVAELKGKKVNFIIVMTHQHVGRNWVIARKVDGIDVIVGGHHKQKLKVPYQANDTYIVQAGEKGQYQGMLEITLASDGTKTAKNTLVPLGEKIPNDPEVKAMIDQFNLSVTKLYAGGKKAEESGANLMSQSCKECHSEEYAIWQKSDHAKAFATLVKRSRQFNPDCLSCHTTRFEEPDGFNMELQQKELRNVQCDSCHGNSALHMNDPGSVPRKDPGKVTCVKCHTPYRCPDFEKNYQAEWEKIKH